jgi:hypothetical protein
VEPGISPGPRLKLSASKEATLHTIFRKMVAYKPVPRRLHMLLAPLLRHTFSYHYGGACHASVEIDYGRHTGSLGKISAGFEAYRRL